MVILFARAISFSVLTGYNGFEDFFLDGSGFKKCQFGMAMFIKDAV